MAKHSAHYIRATKEGLAFISSMRKPFPSLIAKIFLRIDGQTVLCGNALGYAARSDAVVSEKSRIMWTTLTSNLVNRCSNYPGNAAALMMYGN